MPGKGLGVVSHVLEGREDTHSRAGLAFTTNQLSRCQLIPMKETLIHFREGRLCCLPTSSWAQLSSTVAKGLSVLRHKLQQPHDAESPFQ